MAERDPVLVAEIAMENAKNFLQDKDPYAYGDKSIWAYHREAVVNGLTRAIEGLDKDG